MDGDELSSHSVTFMSEEEEQHVDYQEQSLIENYTEMHHVKAHTRDFDQIHVRIQYERILSSNNNNTLGCRIHGSVQR